MRIYNTMRELGLVYSTLTGPWPCEACGNMTQFADIKSDQNHIFCKNPACDFQRTVDKRNHRILESDGTLWSYDPNTSEKKRIRMQ
jgi:hypothetical protein